MSLYSKVAIAIWHEDLPSFKKMFEELKPDLHKEIETPDEIYDIYFWDFVNWAGEKVENLLHKIEDVRHSYLVIREDGDILCDFDSADFRGVDEEFEEILGWDANILVWGDAPLKTREKAGAEIANLRNTLNEKCMEEKTLGWSHKGTVMEWSAYDFLLGRTTTVDLFGDKDVISQIRTEMLKDDENDSKKLLEIYRNANEMERAIMDSVLVCICGWTMSHIMEEAPDWEDD